MYSKQEILNRVFNPAEGELETALSEQEALNLVFDPAANRLRVNVSGLSAGQVYTGTDAARQAASPEAGDLWITTDTDKLWFYEEAWHEVPTIDHDHGDSKIDYSGFPAGTTIIVDWTETPPTGTIEKDGSSLNRTTHSGLFALYGTKYGAADSEHFNVPDWRGLVPRGWDHGAGVDPDAMSRTDRGDGATGDHVGTRQDDDYKSHSHDLIVTNNTSGGVTTRPLQGVYYTPSTGGTEESGGNETRMKNISVMWCVVY